MEEGLSKEQALKEMNLEDRLATLEQGLKGAAPSEPPGKSSSEAANVEAAQVILKALGLEENTPEVTKIFSEHESLESQVTAFAELAKTLKTNQPPTSPADIQPSGGGGRDFRNADAIATELEELYLKPSTPEIEAKIDRLNKELDALIPKK